jgi:hypothetical protein
MHLHFKVKTHIDAHSLIATLALKPMEIKKLIFTSQLFKIQQI